ncbi:MAG: adenylyl-sulfate kinase [Piscirickettsiaceae bacterium]|nr:MAG: adenylyl-sulfate kinase [Piscirickettsiaceae bacterium]PCH83260.1 MAG: adenylyl-sulfate kinase [Piscirickettsiaceae bacterium]PCH84460.1 MAG: adenylyl-sulfate kinase [Piscirickettsiaceae bacterium]
MYKETNKRTLVKGVTWRVVATTTTMVIVYLFFGRLDLAIATGMIESVLKIGLFWVHEKAWFKVRWGKIRIEPFNLWFTGLPLSGKTTIADKVYEELEKLQIPLERIDSKDIRDLIPNIGYSREDRNRHMHRIGNLICTLQNNSISTVASFVSPYKESRKAIREMVNNNIIVYVKANVETCKRRDHKGAYAKALSGEFKNFPGVDEVYEEPEHAEITIDTDSTSVDEAVDIIVKYVKKHYIK